MLMGDLSQTNYKDQTLKSFLDHPSAKLCYKFPANRKITPNSQKEESAHNRWNSRADGHQSFKTLRIAPRYVKKGKKYAKMNIQVPEKFQ